LKHELLKRTSRVTIHPSTLFGEDRPKDIGRVGGTNKQSLNDSVILFTWCFHLKCAVSKTVHDDSGMTFQPESLSSNTVDGIFAKSSISEDNCSIFRRFDIPGSAQLLLELISIFKGKMNKWL